MRTFSKLCDYIAITVSILALVLLFVCPQSDFLNVIVKVAAAIGSIYVIYVIYLLFCGPKFDWHLLHGGFMRKVICFVLLMPFMLTEMMEFTGKIPGASVETKELVLEENLYKSATDTTALHNRQIDPPLLWSVYYHFIDPGNQHMTTTKAGRGWAALISILGVFFLNGLLVSSIVGCIDSRKEKWLKGEIRYKYFLKSKGHYVIIGGNDMVGSIVSQIFNSAGVTTKPYILIQTSSDVESFRRELFSTLTDRQQRRVIIYYGNRDSEEDIKDLCLDRAREVYILGEEARIDDIESYHDTMNMECLGLIAGFLECRSYRSRGKALVCRVLFEYQTTFSVFQFYDIDGKVKSVIDFKPFNYYEMWAQKLFVNKEIDPLKLEAVACEGGFLPLEGADGIKKDDDNYVHLFVVGMSRMGVAMAIEAAHLAHYPNYEQKKIRTKITFVDENASQEKDFFMGRFKELFQLSHWRYGFVDAKDELIWQKPHVPKDCDYLGGDFLDIEWEFINGGIELNAVQTYILESANPLAKVTVAICLPESNRAHAAGLYLDKRIYESDSVLQVLVYNRYGNSIVNAFYSENAKCPYFNKLKSFGAPEDCFDAEAMAQIEMIGKEIDRVYEEINKRFVKPAMKRAGQVDTEVKYKGKSKVAKFWSNIYNGNMTWTKLRSIGYKGSVLFPDEITLLSDVEHNRWNIEQLLMNFRPLTEEEQSAVIEKRQDKEVLKGKMAHLNICSNRRLAELKDVDVAARAYDEGLTTLLSGIYDKLKG